MFANIAFILLVIFIFIRSKSNYSNRVVMNQSTGIAQEIYNYCSKNQDPECYKNSLKKVIDDQDFYSSVKVLYALQDIDPQTKSCHVIAHAMSHEAVIKEPDKWLSLLDGVDVNACGSGFLHGVLEAHLGDKADTKFTGELSEEICNRGNDDYRKRMCTHFMGHFFIVNNNDHVELAVPYCDDVSKSLKFDCLDGLFMEHNQRIALEDHGLAELPDYTPEYVDSLEKVCKKYSGIQAEACWTEMAEIYAKTFGYNADVIYNHCYAQGDIRYAKNCYGKGQTVLSTYPLDMTTKQLTDICKFYNKDEYGNKNCIHNVIHSLLYYSPKYTSRGMIFCQNIPKYNDWCVAQLGERLRQIVPSLEERLSLCVDAKDKNYRNICAQKD